MQVTPQFIAMLKSTLDAGPLGPSEMRRVEGAGNLYLGEKGLEMAGYEWTMDCTLERQPVCLYRKLP